MMYPYKDSDADELVVGDTHGRDSIAMSIDGKMATCCHSETQPRRQPVTVGTSSVSAGTSPATSSSVVTLPLWSNVSLNATRCHLD
jgi:hypothetical protein